MVDFDSLLSGSDESSMKHHPLKLENLTSRHDLAEGHWQPVSFTGAVSSQRVTEEREAWLSMVGNHASSVWVKARLTARPTSRAGAKAGPNDPMV